MKIYVVIRRGEKQRDRVTTDTADFFCERCLPHVTKIERKAVVQLEGIYACYRCGSEITVSGEQK